MSEYEKRTLLRIAAAGLILAGLVVLLTVVVAL